MGLQGSSISVSRLTKPEQRSRALSAAKSVYNEKLHDNAALQFLADQRVRRFDSDTHWDPLARSNGSSARPVRPPVALCSWCLSRLDRRIGFLLRGLKPDHAELGQRDTQGCEHGFVPGHEIHPRDAGELGSRAQVVNRRSELAPRALNCIGTRRTRREKRKQD